MRNGAEHHVQGNFKPKCNFLAIVSVHNFKHAVLSLQLCCTSVCPVSCFMSINKFWAWSNTLKPFLLYVPKILCSALILYSCAVVVSEQTVIIFVSNINWMYKPDGVCLLCGMNWISMKLTFIFGPEELKNYISVVQHYCLVTWFKPFLRCH